MKARKLAAHASKFRPAAAVARDLFRLSAPPAAREAARPTRHIALAGNRVVAVTEGTGFAAITLSLTESDRVRLTVAARAFLSAGARTKRKAEGEVALPFGADETGPTLRAILEEVPAGLAPGTVLTEARIVFDFDAMAETPVVVALADRLVLAEAEVIAAPISLGPVTLTALSDTDVGLAEDPIAQERAERYIMAVLAYQRRMSRQ